jgi:phosphohistidine swiveling domain-containing protein
MNLPGHDAPSRTRTLMSGPSKSSVSAPASVIHSSTDSSRMEPGTIPVCPTTTAAWTPLFSQARGLITDVGGVLAHGSIVAREYDIPAVLGTGVATQRIRSGQMVRLDGSGYGHVPGRHGRGRYQPDGSGTSIEDQHYFECPYGCVRCSGRRSHDWYCRVVQKLERALNGVDT